VTALSGSGPGFIALFTEAMIEAGVKLGLNRPDAVELTVQTVLGTAKLLDTGVSAGTSERWSLHREVRRLRG